jgi:tetratricopeptide (TPR) repeat protein
MGSPNADDSVFTEACAGHTLVRIWNQGGNAMKLPTMGPRLEILWVLAAALLSVGVAHAQSSDSVGQLNQRQTLQRMMGDESSESSDYKVFYDVKPGEPDKKIQIGHEFLEHHPKSPYTEAVYVGLTNAYFAKQDWKNFYSSADRALELKPDNVDVLMTVGWVIPHVYDPNEADAAKLLEKAETDEKLAIEVLRSMARPTSLSEAQFTQFKAQKLLQAHSGLGLVYFRREDFDNAAKELQLATQGNATADQTDLYVLGISLQNLNRPADAADAFNRCGQISGSLQDQCKNSADVAKSAQQK